MSGIPRNRKSARWPRDGNFGRARDREQKKDTRFQSLYGLIRTPIRCLRHDFFKGRGVSKTALQRYRAKNQTTRTVTPERYKPHYSITELTLTPDVHRGDEISVVLVAILNALKLHSVPVLLLDVAESSS